MSYPESRACTNAWMSVGPRVTCACVPSHRAPGVKRCGSHNAAVSDMGAVSLARLRCLRRAQAAPIRGPCERRACRVDEEVAHADSPGMARAQSGATYRNRSPRRFTRTVTIATSSVPAGTFGRSSGPNNGVAHGQQRCGATVHATSIGPGPNRGQPAATAAGNNISRMLASSPASGRHGKHGGFNRSNTEDALRDEPLQRCATRKIKVNTPRQSFPAVANPCTSCRYEREKGRARALPISGHGPCKN